MIDNYYDYINDDAENDLEIRTTRNNKLPRMLTILKSTYNIQL